MTGRNGAATVVSAFLAGALLSTLLGVSTAEAGRKSDEARALERIARVLEDRCRDR